MSCSLKVERIVGARVSPPRSMACKEEGKMTNNTERGKGNRKQCECQPQIETPCDESVKIYVQREQEEKRNAGERVRKGAMEIRSNPFIAGERPRGRTQIKGESKEIMGKGGECRGKNRQEIRIKNRGQPRRLIQQGEKERGQKQKN